MTAACPITYSIKQIRLFIVCGRIASMAGYVAEQTGGEASTGAGAAGRTLAAVYGVLVYVTFLGTFLYAIGFIGDVVVSKAIDTGTQGAFIPSLVIDVALLALFAIQHSVMARPAFK